MPDDFVDSPEKVFNAIEMKKKLMAAVEADDDSVDSVSDDFGPETTNESLLASISVESLNYSSASIL